MKVSEDVLRVLDAAEIAGSQVRLVGTLDRKLYERVNKGLEAAGGKWSRKERAHVFDEAPGDVIDRTILTGEVVAPQDFGFFETPEMLADEAIAEAALEPHHIVLEPSAGTGRIARPASRIAQVDCVEFQPKNARKLFEGKFARKITVGDFLSIPPAREYDRVLMNPPFGRQDDIRHVLHALKFVKPGGLLVGIMSAGVRFRSNRMSVEFRDRVVSCGGRFKDIPDGAFKESGTMVSTTLVIIPC